MNSEFTLDSLDLDLGDIMSQAELDRMIREGKKKKPAPQGVAPEQPKAPKPSPWHCTAAVIIMIKTTCRCGQIYSAPANSLPLAHFDHKRRPDMTREVEKHPSTLNEKLPRSIRWLEQHVEACPVCFCGEGKDDRNSEEETHG